jgi:ABC-type sugar transport system ATPase subunit
LEASGPLVVRDLVKSYQSTVALQGVSFAIRTSEIIAIAGGNGAGKTTLLKIIAGAVAPDSGHVEFNGVKLRPGDVRGARAQGISMVFQDGALCPDATVLDNLFLGSECRTNLGFLRMRQMRSLAVDMINHYRLPLPSLTSLVRDLSGGQQKATALGRALLYKPKLLLLDEPTSALGVREQGMVIESLVGLSQRGVKIVFCTHSPDEILGAARRLIVLRRGELVKDQPLNGIKRSELAVLMSSDACDHS